MLQAWYGVHVLRSVWHHNVLKGGYHYSQTSHKQTPLGPSIAVCFWEVSSEEWLKNYTKHYGE